MAGKVTIATAVVMSCLALAGCGGDDVEQTDTPELESAPQEVLNEIDDRQVRAARSVRNRLQLRGITEHSPINCGVFAEPRESRCSVLVQSSGERDLIIVVCSTPRRMKSIRGSEPEHRPTSRSCREVGALETKRRSDRGMRIAGNDQYLFSTTRPPKVLPSEPAAGRAD
jgi:hypothetical protein